MSFALSSPCPSLRVSDLVHACCPGQIDRLQLCPPGVPRCETARCGCQLEGRLFLNSPFFEAVELDSDMLHHPLPQPPLRVFQSTSWHELLHLESRHSVRASRDLESPVPVLPHRTHQDTEKGFRGISAKRPRSCWFSPQRASCDLGKHSADDAACKPRPQALGTDRSPISARHRRHLTPRSRRDLGTAHNRKLDSWPAD